MGKTLGTSKKLRALYVYFTTAANYGYLIDSRAAFNIHIHTLSMELFPHYRSVSAQLTTGEIPKATVNLHELGSPVVTVVVLAMMGLLDNISFLVHLLITGSFVRLLSVVQLFLG